MAKNRKDALKDLLFFFCDLCKKNDIEYSMIGEPAAVLYETGELPKNYNRLMVALPFGQIQKVISLVEENPKCPYVFNYIINNPDAKSFYYALTDPNFLIMNIGLKRHREFPLSLTIIELKKNVSDRTIDRFTTILRLANRKHLRNIKEPRDYLRVIKWKSKKLVAGKDAFIRRLFEEREKIIALNDWEEACKQKRVILGINRVPGKALRDVQIVDFEGHTLRIAPALTKIINTRFFYTSMRDVPPFQIDLGYIPPEVLKSDAFQDQIDDVIMKRSLYADVFTSVEDETKIIDEMWDIYEMTVSFRQFEEDFNEEFIQKVSSFLDDNKLGNAKKSLMPYLQLKEVYDDRGITFDGAPKIAPLVQRYQKMVEEAEGQEVSD